MNITNISTLKPFGRFCVSLGMIPTSYKESMSYEEQLLWFCNYLETEVIPKYNENVEAINELIVLYNQLREYVENYFENLDVQEEINNKLDAMAESGELAEIVTAYLQVNGVLAFETISDLQAADNLIEGSVCKTLGYNSYNDGLGYLYRVRTYTSGDNIDELNIVSLTNYPTLIAEKINNKEVKTYNNLGALIDDLGLLPDMFAKTGGYYAIGDGGAAEYYIREKVELEVANNITTYELDNGLIAEIIDGSKELYAKKYGVNCDSISDDTLKLQSLIDYAKLTGKEIILNGYAYVTSTIDTKGVKIIGIGKTIHPDYTYTSKKYGYIGFDYFRNVNNGVLITFDDYVDDNLTTGSGIISDTANPILSVNKKDGRFHLENLTICGWLRNATQVGLKNVYDLDDVPSYIYGAHRLNNVSVINCGSHGIELTNLEMTNITNVKSMCNFGYGLYINAIDDIDTPTEYTTIKDSRFCGNKLGGIYINKGFNKNLVIDSCEFTASGLYNQLGESIPANIEDIVAGIKINGYKNAQTTFEVNNCYGEQLNVLINISTYYVGHPFNNIKITENTMYSISSNSALIYFDNYYSKRMTYYNNYNNNGNSFYKTVRSENIIPFECDSDVLNNITNVPTITYNQNLNVTREVIQRFDNQIYVCIEATVTATINANDTLISNYPKPIENVYMPIIVNGSTHYHTWWINRSSSYSSALSQNDTIVWVGVYNVNPYTDKNGNY